MGIKIKNSIRLKLSILLLCLTSGTFILFMLVNQFFLEDYYIKSKKTNLLSAYEKVANYIDNDTVINDETSNSILKICERFGVNMIIVDTADTLGYQFGNTNRLKTRLREVIFGSGKDNAKIIKSTDKYNFQKYHDSSSNNDYYEVWGSFNQKFLFLMQIPIENINESVYVTRSFLFYVGISVSILSIMLAFIISGEFTKPILQLSSISEKMSNMNFESRYDGKSTDEIGVLGNSMNKLSDKLQKNILELKNANNELMRDNQKKKEIDDLRKEFISNVSHELKTPIALIQGYAEGLSECVNNDEESRNFYCEVIMDEANKMNKMVKSLLTLNQLEFGSYKVQIEKFDINLVINGVLHSLDYLIKQENITVEYSENKNNIVYADEFQIEAVITNYLTNAIHYAKGDKIIKISVEKKGSISRISVFNTGDNIKESELDNIWVKFYKVDKARTRQYGGSGVGLSVVQAIMKAHGKGYGVNNKQNGVEFWFELDSDLC